MCRISLKIKPNICKGNIQKTENFKHKNKIIQRQTLNMAPLQFWIAIHTTIVNMDSCTHACDDHIS